jgi:N utilization substance protein B
MGSRREAREWAVQLLFQMDFNPTDVGVALATFWDERKASAKSRQFVEETVRGVLAHRARIDETIQKCAQNWILARMAGVDRNIIRLAAYEMLFRTDIPPAVSINEVLDRLRKDLGGADSRPETGPGGQS